MPIQSKRAPFILATAATLLALTTLAIPLYVIRPFVPQSPRALDLALETRLLAPWLTILCAVVVFIAVIRAWRPARWPGRTFLVAALLLTLPTIALTRVNIFEKMFHPNLAPSFEPAAQATLDPTDMLLAVTLGGQSRAYPIRTLGYHHIINDTLANIPFAVTYCTLCHTGMVWSRALDGLTLHFRLAGINNGNALLRDEETSSIWQQSTGESIFGPLRGRHLQLLHADELTFATWRAEHPTGEVLRPDPSVADQYDPKDWEQHVARTHAVIDTTSSGIEPHEIMFAVITAQGSRAYPLRALLNAGLIEEHHPTSILLVVAPDNASIRAFDPGLRTFLRTPNAAALMTDTETGSQWDFNGCATSGLSKGQCLTAIDGHKTFWFDWLNHHRDSTVYR